MNDRISRALKKPSAGGGEKLTIVFCSLACGSRITKGVGQLWRKAQWSSCGWKNAGVLI